MILNLVRLHFFIYCTLLPKKNNKAYGEKKLSNNMGLTCHKWQLEKCFCVQYTVQRITQVVQKGGEPTAPKAANQGHSCNDITQRCQVGFVCSSLLYFNNYF